MPVRIPLVLPAAEQGSQVAHLIGPVLAPAHPAVLHPLASRVGLVPDWSTLRAATAFVAATAASMLVVPSLAQIFAPSGVHPLHRQPVPGPAATCRPPGGGGA